MNTRVPGIEDADFITKRVTEIRAERMAVIAGCTCGPPEPGQSIEAHKPGCPFGPGLPPADPPCPALAIVIAAEMQRVANKWFMRRRAFAILADHRRAVADAIDEGDGR